MKQCWDLAGMPGGSPAPVPSLESPRHVRSQRFAGLGRYVWLWHSLCSGVLSQHHLMRQCEKDFIPLSLSPQYFPNNQAWFSRLFKVVRKSEGFPGATSGKELSCQCRRQRDVGSVLGSERSPGGGSPTHSSLLAWRIPWTEEPGGLQSMGSQRVRHD